VISFRVYKGKDAAAVSTKQSIVVKNDTKSEIELWNLKVNKLQNSVKAANSLIVLRGTTDISAEFDNKEFTGAGNTLKWLTTSLSNLKSKSISINTSYKFGYSFPMAEAKIVNISPGKIQIVLYQDQLKLEYVEEITANTTLTPDYSVFAASFTPQQTSVIMERVHTYSQNNIINNSKIRLAAIESTKKDLIAEADKYGFKNTEVIINGDNLLDNDEVIASNIKYNLTNNNIMERRKLWLRK